VAVAKPSMIHDFAITDREVVFWELPVLFDLSLLSTGIPYGWKPSYGARLGVMPLGGPTSAIQWVEIEPCYVFHGVNAFHDDGIVVIDVCRHSKMFDPDITGGELDLRRWKIDTRGPSLAFTEEIIGERQRTELPTRDPRVVGREHRYGYLLSTHDDGEKPVFEGVVKQDFRSGTRERWIPGAGRQPNEFLFVPTGRSEDDGYLLSYVYDPVRDKSDLVILDARDVGAGPVATIRLPARVPYGFHGTWVPDA
jgi:carotenoid cleavage dioxygenase-like enzyme